MKQLYQIPDTGVTFEVDTCKELITITDGKFETKAEFLELIKSHYLLILLNQFFVGESGCVEPTAYDIYMAVKNHESEQAYKLAAAWYHEFDDFEVVVKLK